jgi:hypothetical protein
MIPEWKTIKEHGVPENNRSVLFIDTDGVVYIGYFRTHTKGQYKGAVFVEARAKNESNGMFGSYVHNWNNRKSITGLADIERWDYLPNN